MNVDNFLGSRPSTRVHAPPGGRSSICFGSEEPAAPVRRTVARPAAAKREEPAPPVSRTAAPSASAAPKPVLRESNPATVSATTTAAAAPKGRVSSNAYANGSNQNCGNFITDRPTTRLHAPPGGKSSFSLGWN